VELEDANEVDPRLVDRLWERTRLRIAGRPPLPEATYRLQFHAGFTFRDAAALADYFQALGITHCYASPYLKARPGSTHGYDIIDHGSLNPEIGSVEDYEAWVRALEERGIGQVLDIVPNHMGVATNDNAWWNDVLENGPSSRFAAYFDIAWGASPRPELHDRVLLPVLGEPYGDVLESGDLRLVFEGGTLSIAYHDRRFPVAPRGYGRVLGLDLDELKCDLGPEDPALLEYQSILTAARNLPDAAETDPLRVAERAREKEIIKRRLGAIAADSAKVRAFIDRNVARFNGTPGEPSNFDLLDDLLEHQCYRLSYWRVAADEINYRRFFDINDLAALSMEREEVFAASHALVLRLVVDGKVDGLRIDHPDGLYDPAQYFARLQQAFVLACAQAEAGSDPELKGVDWPVLERPLRKRLVAVEAGWSQRPLYVVAEKILGADESLVESWPVHGSSGYDFMNMTNGLFVDQSNEAAFTRLYHEWTGDDTPYAELVYQKKRLILDASLSSELHMLTHQLDRLAQKGRRSRDFTFNTLRRAMREVISCFPVYRSYIADEGPHEADRRHVLIAVRRAMLRNPLISRRVFRFIRDMLMLESLDGASAEDRAERRRFAGKFQQVTAPVTAKGIEDTVFYVFNRLGSLNEVGGDPNRFGVAPKAFHDYNAERQRRWPHALAPLSTHDTKRSEDVRARLNVLSELPDDWRERLTRWEYMNEPHREQVEDQAVPGPNEEFMFYQALIGAWPLEPDAPGKHERLVSRIQAYMEKALHEAKAHTSWIYPNEEYDAAVRKFIDRVLDPALNGPFLESFRAFQQRISHYGLFNSLSQTLLKITCPGVPDTYQGTETWDFSLVDPDNRQPVDYERRRTMLGDLDRAASSAGEDLRELSRGLVGTIEDGRIKLYVTSRALRCRRDCPGLFSAGGYLPLTATGEKADHVFAFARRDGSRWALVAVPRMLTRLVPDADRSPLGAGVWGETSLSLESVPTDLAWRNVFTGATVGGTDVKVADLLADFPVALLVADQET
jgi:(1->4)-alpha-D-glucan 1-alpha-D-glucosylmutase